MGVLFANNAVGALAAGYTAAATAVTLQAGQGAKFPSPTVSDWFYVTFTNSGGQLEIAKCTNRAGDTLTVARGQQGTVAMALTLGDSVEARLTSGALADLMAGATLADGSVSTAKLADAAVTLAKLAANSVDASKIVDGSVGTAELADGSVTASKLAAGVALNNLGYTPVHQGGGVGQLTDIVYLGWTAVGKLGVTIDVTDNGYILTEMAAAPAWSGGYRGMPQNGQDANYTFQIADAGRHVLHTSATAHTWWIDTEANVAIPRDNAILLVNIGAGAVTVGQGAGVTLTFLPSGVTGSRTLAQNGVATLLKVNTNSWVIFGAGIS